MVLYEVCNWGYYDVVKQLLVVGVEVNIKGLDDDMFLYDVVNNGYYKVVKLLLWYGGNLQQSNRKGEMLLKVVNFFMMVNFLLGKGIYIFSEESLMESLEEEDVLFFVFFSLVDGNNMDFEFEKGFKYKVKNLELQKVIVFVKDEYEFDEDDEQDRVFLVDDKYLLKKDYRKEMKFNSFIFIFKMEVKSYIKNNMIVLKKVFYCILLDMLDEEDVSVIVGIGEKLRFLVYMILFGSKI